MTNEIFLQNKALRCAQEAGCCVGAFQQRLRPGTRLRAACLHAVTLSAPLALTVLRWRRVDRVLELMQDRGCRLNLLILDACRNKPSRMERGKRAGGLRGFRRMDAPEGTVIAFACAPGATAADGDGKNGVFTSHLLRHVTRAGMDVDMMLREVAEGVARDTNAQQKPWWHKTVTKGGDLCLLPAAATVAPAAQQPQPQAGASFANVLDAAAADGADVPGLTRWLAANKLAGHESSVIPKLVAFGAFNADNVELLEDRDVRDMQLARLEERALLAALAAARKAATAEEVRLAAEAVTAQQEARCAAETQTAQVKQASATSALAAQESKPMHEAITVAVAAATAAEHTRKAEAERGAADGQRRAEEAKRAQAKAAAQVVTTPPKQQPPPAQTETSCCDLFTYVATAELGAPGCDTGDHVLAFVRGYTCGLPCCLYTLTVMLPAGILLCVCCENSGPCQGCRKSTLQCLECGSVGHDCITWAVSGGKWR